MERLIRYFHTFIMVLAFAIVLFLALINAVNTCYIAETEKTYFLGDSAVLNVLLILGSGLLLAFLKNVPPIKKGIRKINDSEKCYKYIHLAVLVLLFLMGLFWVCSVRMGSVADQELILNGVRSFRAGDYSMFAPDGYFARCRHQLGLAFVYLILSYPLGGALEQGISILYAFLFALFYHELDRIAYHMGVSAAKRLAISVLGILFFPLLMYCSFIYGNLPGLTFSTAALSHSMHFCRAAKKKDRICQVIATAIFLMLAIFSRQNTMINCIALIIFVILQCASAKTRKNRISRGILLAVIGLVIFFSLKFPTVFFRQTTGYPLNQGETPLSYVVVGLGDSSLAPGWYNHYNLTSYEQAGYQTDVQVELAKTEIRYRLDYMLTHKSDAVRHMLMKQASIWSNPTFQSFWLLKTRPTETDSSLVRLLTSPEMEKKLCSFLNVFWFAVLSGMLMYLLDRSKRASSTGDEERILSCIPCILTFIGGFLFHLVWEAKAQYTITYAVLLFPYAVMGYGFFAERLHSIPGVIRERKISKHFALALLFVVLFVIAAMILGENAHCLSEDTLSLP